MKEFLIIYLPGLIGFWLAYKQDKYIKKLLDKPRGGKSLN